MTADHGNRARCQPHEGIEVKGRCQACADDVLADDEDRRDDGHFKDHDPASFDEADAGRVANAGEKRASYRCFA